MMIEPSTFSDLISYPIRDIVQKAKKIEEKGTDMIYLNVGDPGKHGFKPPEHITSAASEAIEKQEYTSYAPTAGDPELREVVADEENVSKDDVFITSGLTEGIDFIYKAFMDPGMNMLLPRPCYPLYLTKERIHYGTINFYECDDDYQPDIESLRSNINDRTRAIVVISPNNPTGAVYSKNKIKSIVDLAGEYDLPIIYDGAYSEISFGDKEVTKPQDVADDVPIISGNSMSKNFIYPGARVGYLALHGEGWEEMKNVFQRICNQRLSMNWEMQRSYITALKKGFDHIEEFNKEVEKRRDLLIDRVEDIEGLSLSPPSGAFYAFIKIEDDRWSTDKEFVNDLLHEGVVTVPGSGFGATDKKYFRVVILSEEETLNRAFDRIENMME